MWDFVYVFIPQTQWNASNKYNYILVLICNCWLFIHFG